MKLRILIIDNIPRSIEFVKRDLDAFEIVVAHNTNEALIELAKDQFDLVIASSHNLGVFETIGKKCGNKRMVITTIQPNQEKARNPIMSTLFANYSN